MFRALLFLLGCFGCLVVCLFVDLKFKFVCCFFVPNELKNLKRSVFLCVVDCVSDVPHGFYKGLAKIGCFTACLHCMTDLVPQAEEASRAMQQPPKKAAILCTVLTKHLRNTSYSMYNHFFQPPN